jgi:Uma2 family endonuclease
MAVTSKPLTLEQFLALPEEKPALEFADGVVTQKVSPKTWHSALQAELIKRLDQASASGKIARAFPELRATFGGVSRVPDVAVYRPDRIPRDKSGRMVNDLFEPPNITMEIVSPGQSTTALVRRCLWYVAHEVQIALLVDPEDESVLAFRPQGRLDVWRGTDRIDLHEVLLDFDLTVDQLYSVLK